MFLQPENKPRSRAIAVNTSVSANEWITVWHLLCLILFIVMQNFPFRLEKLTSTIVANLDLPTPKSGKFLFRLVRFPLRGTDTVLDLVDYRNRVLLRVTRMLKSPRNLLLSNSKNQIIPVEISSEYISKDEYLITELPNITSSNLPESLEDIENGNHYFIFFTDSETYTASGITNPYQKSDTELWQRLINRSYGLEHRVPRRHLRSCNLLNA